MPRIPNRGSRFQTSETLSPNPSSAIFIPQSLPTISTKCPKTITAIATTTNSRAQTRAETTIAPATTAHLPRTATRITTATRTGVITIPTQTAVRTITPDPAVKGVPPIRHLQTEAARRMARPNQAAAKLASDMVYSSKPLLNVDGMT